MSSRLAVQLSSNALAAPSAAAGHALAPADQQFFESQLQTDLSQVRLHTDASAASSAQALNANAFATGEHISFAHGQYQPGTTHGRQLLAHELSHVLQQRNSQQSGGQLTAQASHSLDSASAEQHAHSNAAQTMQGANPALEAHGQADPGVYCEEKKPEAVTTATPATAPAISPSFAPFKLPTLQPLPNLQLSPQWLPPQLTLPSLLAPRAAPPISMGQYGQTDTASLLATFSAYGTSPAALGIDIESDKEMARIKLSYLSYFGKEYPAIAADIALNSAYGAMLTLDSPSIFDKSKIDFAAAYPDEIHTPMLPVSSLFKYIAGKAMGTPYPFPFYFSRP